MNLPVYVMIEANSPNELQEKCSELMNQEEMDGEVMYVYEALGAPLIDKDMQGFPIFLQAFTIQMLMPMGEPPQQRLDS